MSNYKKFPAQDKTVIFCEGAGHGLIPDRSKYGGIADAIFDLCG